MNNTPLQELLILLDDELISFTSEELKDNGNWAVWKTIQAIREKAKELLPKEKQYMERFWHWSTSHELECYSNISKAIHTFNKQESTD